MVPSSKSASFWSHLLGRAFHKKCDAEEPGLRPPSPTESFKSSSGKDGHHVFHHLKRQLGFWQLTMLGVGGSIGAGVFSLTGVAAASAGPAVVFSFIFSGIIAAIDALCYSEMASRYPQAGTVFLYNHITFGELPALLGHRDGGRTKCDFDEYQGFDTIASSSEECKDPLRDLPRAILVSLGVCVGIYCVVCLILTGMVPYDMIDLAAPLSSAFAGLGLAWVPAVISLGGVVGLATTLLIGLFAQARIWLGIARDGLLPGFLAEIHPRFKTPFRAQMLCGVLPMCLSAFFNVKLLAELLDVGVILAYGTVCAAVLVQRSTTRVNTTRWLVLLLPACALPFALHKYNVHTGIWAMDTILLLLPIAALVPLVRPGDYPAPAHGVCFACPAVPYLPLAGVVLNVYLGVNLNSAAWLRLAVLWAGLLVHYVWTEHQYFHGNGEKRGRQFGERSGSRRYEGTENGVVPYPPFESLRRRRGVGGGGSGQSQFGGGGGGGGGGGENSSRTPLLDGDDAV
ncbi:hypothetical protein VYU27_000478 [Nannochloropsis oceanica]